MARMLHHYEDIFSIQHSDMDLELLQTDIQRFLAIIGFCLMAVFALVQSIPVVSPQPKTVVKDLNDQLSEQKYAIDQLRSENKRLKTKLIHQKKDSEKSTLSSNPKKTQSKAKGIYVAFESDQIFMRLLKSQTIKLFIQFLDINLAFQVKMIHQKLEFEKADIDHLVDLWQVSESLIPEYIFHAFQSWTSLASQNKMIIVGLSPGISKQIRNIHNVKHGKFIIGKNGKVHFHP